jgi:predicted membrane-bound mannosyltransferase
MSATDRELLEAAARAAGIELVEWRDHAMTDGGFGAMLTARGTGTRTWWNPLTDDGDALRLAVKLNLTIKYDIDSDGAEVFVGAPWHDEFPSYWWIESLGKDSSAATRRAIVRAAAAIAAASVPGQSKEGM